MTHLFSLPEYRIVLPGRAVSFRSPKAAQYKERVKTAARGVFPSLPSSAAVEVRLDYFHRNPRRVDMDNVTKCILDALTGVAYVDDSQVKSESSTARPLHSELRIQGGPVDLIKPLAEHDEYVFVRVRYAKVASPKRTAR